MKKFLSAVLFLFLFPSVSFCLSDDVYVRKDVFEIYMQRIDDKFNVIMSDMAEMKSDIKDMRQDIQ